MPALLYVGQRCTSDENEHIEFKTHMKNSTCEVTLRVEGDVLVRQMQPLSQTICAFLNTDGGRIYIGIDDTGIVRGVPLTNYMKEHYLASLIECLYRFVPRVPPEFIQVRFIRVREPDRPDKCPDPDWPTDTHAYQGSHLSEADRHNVCGYEHIFGRQKCFCESGSNDDANRYVIVVKVLPDPSVIYRNDEGLVYFRRHGSNKMISIADLLTFHNTPFIERPSPHRYRFGQDPKERKKVSTKRNVSTKILPSQSLFDRILRLLISW